MQLSAALSPACSQADDESEAYVLSGHSGSILALSFSPDGKYLVSGGEDEALRIWEKQGAVYELRNSIESERTIHAVSFSPDGRLCMESGERIRDTDNHLGVWFAGGASISRKPLNDTWNVDVYALAVTRKKNRIACGLGDYTVKLMDATTLRPVSVLEGHTGVVRAVAFNADGTLLATGGDDGSILLWNTATGRLSGTLAGHAGEVLALAFHPNGKTLASAGSDQQVIIWTIATKTIGKSLQGHTDDITCLAISPDGKMLASGSLDHTVRLWSADKGTEIRTLLGHEDAVHCLAFAPSGGLVASAGSDKNIRLWALGQGPRKLPPAVADIPRSDAPEPGSIRITLLEPSPSRGMKVVQQSEKVTIKGRVKSPSNVRKVYVNEQEARLTKSGDFSLALPLEEGENVITVRAVDAKQRSAEETFTVTRETPSVSQKLATGRGKEYALLIALDEYDEWKELVNPVNDAKAIAAELNGSYGFQTELLTNPSQAEILSTLRKYAGRTYADGDQLFLFIAGHGQFDEVLGDGYIVSRDSRLDDDIKTSYISHSTLRTVINNIPCRHILLVVDACFGGTFDPLIAANGRGDDEYSQVTKAEFIERKLRFKTRRFLTSGGKEYVPDGRPGQHSPFTRRFLEALRSYGGKDGILTLGEIQQYIEKVTPEPRAGEFGTNDPGSDFLFIAR